MTLEERRQIAQTAIQFLKAAIEKKSKTGILLAYEFTEPDSFNWDDLDNEFNQFDELAEIANDILYED
jgi:hypothetical protein